MSADGIVEIRAREISALRRQNRALQAELSALRDRAGENDATLMTLHKLALLLAAKAGERKSPRAWAGEAEEMLAKALCGRGGHCKIAYFPAGADSELKRAASRLRADGYAGEVAPAGIESPAGMRSYCATPLRNGRETIGVIALSSRKPDLFPPDASRDFLRRLAQLLAAAAP